MDGAGTHMLTGWRLKLLVALAGGAGAYAVSRAASTVWFGASFRLRELVVLSSPLVVNTVVHVAAATIFAIWFGRFVGRRGLADWAAVAFLAFTFLPWLLSALLYAVTGGENPLEFSGLSPESVWPLVVSTLPIAFGFPIGAWWAERQATPDEIESQP